MTDPGVIAIFGPTASGKSAVAQALAERVPAGLVSADAMQTYRGLPILTNQPLVSTRLVAIWPLDHHGSVGEYQMLAHEAIDDILAARRTAVVVGGTGLYLRAALSALEVPPRPAPGERERWEAAYDREGAEWAHARLTELDIVSAAAVHQNDRRRVVRALELATAGRSLVPEQDRLWSGETRRPTCIVGLNLAPTKLERRIEERTHTMFATGVEEEVRRALAGPISPTVAKTLGLREVAELPRAEAISSLARRTRRYAAYQRKWMRRIAGLVSVEADRPAGEIADEILEVARTRQRLSARRAG